MMVADAIAEGAAQTSRGLGRVMTKADRTPGV